MKNKMKTDLFFDIYDLVFNIKDPGLFNDIAKKIVSF